MFQINGLNNIWLLFLSIFTVYLLICFKSILRILGNVLELILLCKKNKKKNVLYKLYFDWSTIFTLFIYLHLYQMKVKLAIYKVLPMLPYPWQYLFHTCLCIFLNNLHWLLLCSIPFTISLFLFLLFFWLSRYCFFSQDTLTLSIYFFKFTKIRYLLLTQTLNLFIQMIWQKCFVQNNV